MPGGAHLLVVEDDTTTRALLTTILENEGFQVSAAETVTEARDLLTREDVALVLLDLNLPDDDGLTLARELLRRPRLGLIMVTSRSDVMDRVLGLELGADDYVTKPFLPRELLARVRTVLRRLNPPPDESGTLRFAGWVLDTHARQLLRPDGSEVKLTRAEFDLLAALAGSPGKVQSREFLLAAVSSRDWAPVDRTVDVLVSRIRRKIEEDPKTPRMIQTIAGVGYKFSPPRSQG